MRYFLLFMSLLTLSAIAIPSPAMAQSSSIIPIKAEGQGQLSQSGPHGVYALRTLAEWEKFQAQRGVNWAANIDFSHDMIVAVFLGTRNTAGFKAEFAEIRAHPHHTEVTYREIAPQPSDVAAQVLTTPYTIAIIAQQQTPVVFSNDFFGTVELPHGEYTRLTTYMSETSYQLDDIRRQKKLADDRIRDLSGMLMNQ